MTAKLVKSIISVSVLLLATSQSNRTLLADDFKADAFKSVRDALDSAEESLGIFKLRANLIGFDIENW